MKKFFKLLAITAAIMFLFVGCKDDIDDSKPKDTTVYVESVNILVDGAIESGIEMLVGQTAQITAAVLPAKATNKNYDLSVTYGQDVITLAGSTLTAVKGGIAEITATSKGKDKSGKFVTGTISVVVDIDPESITNLELLVHNQNLGSVNAKTTTSLPALNAQNRYVIVNNEANAQVVSAWNQMAGATIVYLNKPLKMKRVNLAGTGEEPNYEYTPYSIKARVKIAGGRDTGTLDVDSTNQSVLVGIFTNPIIPPNMNDFNFVTMRSTWGGQKRMYTSRYNNGGNDNSATAINNTIGHDSNDSVRTKDTGFKEQEYVYEVKRTNDGLYNLTIFESDGTTQIATNTRTGNNQLTPNLQSLDNYLYLGFIITGVTAEISDIEITEGDGSGNLVKFEAAMAANPDTNVAVNRVLLSTASPKDPGNGFDYRDLLANVSSGVTLTAVVHPKELTNKNVTWSATGGGTVSNGAVTFTTGGDVTVKAASVADATKFGEFKFHIFTTTPPVEKIEILGNSSVMAGNGAGVAGKSITLKADINPAAAKQEVSWAVWMNANGTGSAAAYASINASGVLKAVDTAIAADTVVYVIASATDSSNVKEIHEVTVRKYDPAAVSEIWSWKSGETWTALTSSNITAKNGTPGISTTRGGGTIQVAGDPPTINLGGARFVLGYDQNVEPTTSGYFSAAELDLSKKFKVTVVYHSAGTSGNFFVYIYNNTGGSGGGPITSTLADGSANAIILRATATASANRGDFALNAAGDTISVTVDPANDLALRTEAANAGLTKDQVLKNATLHFRCDSALTSFLISEILVEYD